jgi:hypothetical protein
MVIPKPPAGYSSSLLLYLTFEDEGSFTFLLLMSVYEEL